MALISTTGPVCPNVVDTPLDNRSRVSTYNSIGSIPLAWKGMLVYCEENGNTYKVTSLKPKRSGPVEIENYYPATWVEFGSGGSTPSPTPSAIDAGDVSYSSSGTFNDGTVGKELQNLASHSGDIVGATVGGTKVPINEKVLQFDAYPTANTMQYSSSINYGSGTIGKEVKSLNGNVNDLSIRVADLEEDKPSPTPSPSTTVVNLASYTTSGSSFTYDVDNKYIYNTKDTTFYQYSEESDNTTVYYGVFKVIGEDKYLRYKITNNTTFTYEGTYTESSLPENAKKEFALGSVAVVKRVNGKGESWKNGTVNLFCTNQNMPLRNRCKNINFNGSTAWRVLIKSEDGNTIFVYKANINNNYEWEINVPRSSTANFNFLDKYFDRPDASDVDFSNTNTGLNATNVNTAIDEVFTTLKHTSGSATVSSGSFTLPSTVTGNTYYDITSTPITSLTIPSINSLYEVVIKFTTDSTNICTILIPNGQKYIGDLSVDKDITYIMSIFNGVIIIAETETKTNS